MIDIAQKYIAAGLCALPAKRAEKRPTVAWKAYQKQMPTPVELKTWFDRQPAPDAICVLCGAASGHLEVIDFDASGELFDAWKQKIPAELMQRLVVERSPSGGYHVLYRYAAGVSGNMKLAQRRRDEKTTTLIETRGEGGLVLCAPTVGYVVTQGDLCDAPTVTADDRDLVLRTAWELNEYVPPIFNGPECATDVAHSANRTSDNSHNGDDVGHDGESASHNSHSAAHVEPNAAMSSHNSHNGTDVAHDGDGVSNNSHSDAYVGPNAAMSSHNSNSVAHVSPMGDRPGDDFNRRGDVREILTQHGWACVRTGENEYWRRPGKTVGWSATLRNGCFYVFSANASPFEPNRAYSPFSVYALLEHNGRFDDAARALRDRGFGPGGPYMDSSVDLSGIMGQTARTPLHTSHNGFDVADDAPLSVDGVPQSSRLSTLPDPGPMPAEMLRIPGFISEVMDTCLDVAPYPNQPMAFAGALSLLALLAGRKVRDAGDNRTNIYLLGLAHSSAGKDGPRKINKKILFHVGLANLAGEKIASGEGIQDELCDRPAMLFQTDEVDGMLQSINRAKDARHEAIMGTLLTMYSSANSVFTMRRKAGKEQPRVIDQPNLVLFGTAIPTHYYEALSERMLTNGFFARMIILEAGPRGEGQEPKIIQIPPRILEQAQWWADYRPGTGNLESWHPVPTVIEHSDEAKRLLIETRKQAEAEYTAAESRNDAVGTTVWGRVSEHVRKLALIYAISENRQSPQIGASAVQWASEFVIHQTRRMLFMAAGHVAESEFDALIKRAIDLLRKWADKHGGEALMPAWELRRRLNQRPADFKDVCVELIERRIAVFGTETAATKPKSGYRLL
jgi:hypothetical protein